MYKELLMIKLFAIVVCCKLYLLSNSLVQAISSLQCLTEHLAAIYDLHCLMTNIISLYSRPLILCLHNKHSVITVVSVTVKSVVTRWKDR